MRHLLFLCTGNYYRSRFAEHLFNELAARKKLNWVADSRGLATELGVTNTGSISTHALAGLHTRQIEVGGKLRQPLQLQAADLSQADLVIAMDEAEHRPFMQQRFPEWADRIEYWHVADLQFVPAEEALSLAEREVRALVESLSAGNAAA